VKKKNPHIGSSFRTFLKEEDIAEDVTAHAKKRVEAWQLDEAKQRRRVERD
jgi:hypothetical protein